ncbi:hypothetical protein MTX78_17495 [Hymenobacter tibetensis]|uniref:DUF1735 domain-containing protein n=1 Tax=Hymenobacter tibetensis TaxID=497967 RepID=A0ABY4CUN6_9BACT|nr:hypothetical protein [Hymenobacter tibetensis]UOG73903.1 hypothetical protein MTX78_17495 [Hymenobacter tibetensis]
MKNHFIKLCAIVFLSAGFFACEKDYGDNLGPVEDSLASIPVTVSNAEFTERYPVITTSVSAGGNFTINFEIPADKGKIAAITKVATGPSAISNLANLNSTAAASSLNTAPIAGNGTNQISFTSTLADYLAYRIRNGAAFGPVATTGNPPVAVVPTALPAPSTNNIPTEIQYYFRLTLEDGTTIVPMPVRVRLIP